MTLPQEATRRSRQIKEHLRALLRGPLPGRAAHAQALPPGFEREPIPEGIRVTQASVLLALQPAPRDGRIVFPLIRRPDGIDPHAGQVALPGGARERGEDPVSCALREAHEEIGLNPEAVEPLGRLTPIMIPVSCHRVETVIGWLTESPHHVAHESEVLRILLADTDRLAWEGPTLFVNRSVGGRDLRFPAYAVQDEKVWGATALILAEFLHLWREAART